MRRTGGQKGGGNLLALRTDRNAPARKMLSNKSKVIKIFDYKFQQ
jgi:hypothetical protein